MDRSQVWDVVRIERLALVEDLAALEPSDWTTPSLCEGWDVHDVVAHLLDAARTSRRSIAVRMLRTRFDFDRDNADGVARERRPDPADTLAALAAAAPLRLTPPAAPATRLVEAVVHGEDVRRRRHAAAPIGWRA